MFPYQPNSSEFDLLTTLSVQKGYLMRTKSLEVNVSLNSIQGESLTQTRKV